MPFAREADRAAETLGRPDPGLGVPLPAYEGRSNANIVPTWLRNGDAPSTGTPLAPALAPELDPWSGRRPEGTTIVLLIDGLGWHSFRRAAETSSEPQVRAWEEHARPITTVFPTTTVAGLVSLSTGVPPGRHGAAGYRLFLPGFGVVVDLLKMTPLGVNRPESLTGPAWQPSIVSAAPTVFRRATTGSVVSREAFEGTAFTRTLYDGAEFVGYSTASEFVHLLGTLLNRPQPPSLIYAYWDELDTVHHRQGPLDDLYQFELERLAHALGYLAKTAGSRAAPTTVLVTGDHGQVPSSREHQIHIEAIPEIARELAHPMGGDRRGGYFAALPGRIDELRSALRTHLPPGSTLLSMSDALAAGLFGPPPWHPELRIRLGDFLALVPAPYGLVHQLPGSTPGKRHLAGSHGGLDAAELLVPLVAGPLSDFR